MLTLAPRPSRGLMRANLLAATVFATAHLPGMLVGADPAASAAQWAYTWCFGFAAVAALAYARNIWPLVIIHAGTNLASYLVSGDHLNTATPALADALSQVILLALPALFGFWLVRRAERKALRAAGMASRSAIMAMPADGSSGPAQRPE